MAFLVAGLVGQQGTVVGIDFNAELIQTARARAAAAGLENVSFVVGDAASVELDRGFDAVVGRCVLFFAQEPAALVRRLTGYVRDGGVVAFQEPANATLAPTSLPPSPLLQRLWEWILETYRRADMDLYMGLRLHSIFAQAGLPAPAMHLDAAAGGGPDWPGYEYMARLIRRILPQITKPGVEIGDDGAAVTWGFITAWARRQARPPRVS